MDLVAHGRGPVIVPLFIETFQKIRFFDLLEDFLHGRVGLFLREERGDIIDLGEDLFLNSALQFDSKEMALGFIKAIAQITGNLFVVMPDTPDRTVFTRRDVLLSQYCGNAVKMDMAMRENGWTTIQ